MGLASALSTALTGMTAAETTIDVVGNNLANTSTVGFKASEANFATQFLQTRGLGSAPSDTSGGTNPRQVGLGVQVAEITPDFSQGTIEISSSPSDLAIQGDGFFIVQASTGEQLYTRNGILKTNSENELVTISGNRLLGYGIDSEFNIQTTTLQPITIPLGSAAVAQATENVFFEGNLVPTGDIATTAEVIQTAVLGDEQFEQPAAAPDRDVALAPDVVGPPPSAAADSGNPGGPSAGTYHYRVVFIDAGDRESEVSASFTGTTAGPNDISLTNIPAADPRYVARRIYRTDTDAAPTSTYRLVGTIPDIGTPVFTDSADDAAWAAGNALDTTNLTGQYEYHITYFTATVETRPSPATIPINITDGRVILDQFPAPPTGAPFDTDPYQIRIYRNLQNSPETFYRVGELDPSDSPLTYVDNAPDSFISDSATNPDYRLLDPDGPKILSSTRLVDVIRRDDQNYENLFAEGTLTFSPDGTDSVKKGDATLGEKTFQITNTTTVQELIDFMVDAFGIQASGTGGDDPQNPIPLSAFGATPGVPPGGSVTTDGRIQLVGNNGTANSIQIGNSGFELFSTAAGGVIAPPNLSFSSVQEAVGESVSSSFLVYDTLGIPLNVRVTAVLEAQNSTTTTYRWFADSADNDPASGAEIKVGTGLIEFDGDGNVLEVTNSTVSIDRANISATSPLEFQLDFTQLSGLADANGRSSTLSATRQDGSGAGSLSSFIVGEDGTVRGVFTNGITRDLGQIRLARFANPAGLEARGQNLFAGGVNSGLPIEGNPGQQGIGALIAGATELSNTDVGKNLIDLILASTQYRGNTRVITTAQQLFDELLNLRR